MRTRLCTLLSALILLGACGDDDGRKSTWPTGDGSVRDDGGVAADGGPIDIRDSSIDGMVPSIDASSDAANRAPDGAIINPIPLGDGGPFIRNDAGQVLCGTVPCQCSDGIDQDSDGLIDSDDPECVAPWDNDESTFATGISGDNRDEACQDCFFDGNSGAGNDGCRVATSCLTTGQPTSGRGGCDTCTASDRCVTFCRAYTPNGCDCFGCCTVNLGSGITKSVQLGAGCDINGTMLSDACVQCIPSTSCVNTCGRCELCPGKTLADLPADCTSTQPPPDGGTTTPDGGTAPDGGPIVGSDAGTSTPIPQCELGEQPCGAGLPSCGGGLICAFGCCILTPLI